MKGNILWSKWYSCIYICRWYETSIVIRPLLYSPILTFEWKSSSYTVVRFSRSRALASLGLGLGNMRTRLSWDARREKGSIFQYFWVNFSTSAFFSISRIFSIFQSFQYSLALASLGNTRTRLRCQQEEGRENASPLSRSNLSSCFFSILE